MPEPNPLRLIIVEDNPLLRQNLVLLLGDEPDLKIVGDFESAEEALAALGTLRPELMLVDLGLPVMSGVELIRQAKARLPKLDIMAHTINEDRESVFSALKAGASGYLVKGATGQELIEALHTLHDGGAPMTPKIARTVISHLQGDVPEEHDLSDRECEVLVSIGEGLTYKEIGDKLCLSVHTVHTHIKNIYGKLQAKSKTDALLKARRKGIL